MNPGMVILDAGATGVIQSLTDLILWARKFAEPRSDPIQQLQIILVTLFFVKWLLFKIDKRRLKIHGIHICIDELTLFLLLQNYRKTKIHFVPVQTIIIQASFTIRQPQLYTSLH